MNNSAKMGSLWSYLEFQNTAYAANSTTPVDSSPGTLTSPTYIQHPTILTYFLLWTLYLLQPPISMENTKQNQHINHAQKLSNTHTHSPFTHNPLHSKYSVLMRTYEVRTTNCGQTKRVPCNLNLKLPSTETQNYLFTLPKFEDSSAPFFISQYYYHRRHLSKLYIIYYLIIH